MKMSKLEKRVKEERNEETKRTRGARENLKQANVQGKDQEKPPPLWQQPQLSCILP